MSADLHIVVINPDNINLEEVRAYMSWDGTTTLPGKDLEQTDEWFNVLSQRLYQDESVLVDNIWVGQVSWMKSASLEYPSYIPAVVNHISELYRKNNGVLQITEKNIPEIIHGFTLPSNSVYEQPAPVGEENNWYRGIAIPENIEKFLRQHLNAWTVADSW